MRSQHSQRLLLECTLQLAQVEGDNAQLRDENAQLKAFLCQILCSFQAAQQPHPSHGSAAAMFPGVYLALPQGLIGFPLTSQLNNPGPQVSPPPASHGGSASNPAFYPNPTQSGYSSFPMAWYPQATAIPLTTSQATISLPLHTSFSGAQATNIGYATALSGSISTPATPQLPAILQSSVQPISAPPTSNYNPPQLPPVIVVVSENGK